MFVCVWVAEGTVGPDSRRSGGGRSIVKLRYVWIVGVRRNRERGTRRGDKVRENETR